MTLFGPLLALVVSVAPPPAADEERAPIPSLGVPTAGALETSVKDTRRFKIVHTARATGAADYLAKEIEHLRDDVGALVGRDWPGVTEVRLGFGREEYEALALPGALPPSWAVALAYPDANIVLVEAHSLVQGDGQTTLRHELVHVALGQLGRAWPRWFQEGLAQELTGERKFRVNQFAVLSRAVVQDRIFRFDDLTTRFPSYADDVEIAYAQSVAFVEFLRDRHGPAAFGALIDRVRAGDPFEKAFGIAFHSPLSVEEKVFRDELPRRYPWWPLLLSGGTVVWGLMSFLLVAAWVKRRHAVSVLRAEQLRVERLEDLARALVRSQPHPANDDSMWLDDPNAELELPWTVTSVSTMTVSAKERRDEPGRAPAQRT